MTAPETRLTSTNHLIGAQSPAAAILTAGSNKHTENYLQQKQPLKRNVPKLTFLQSTVLLPKLFRKKKSIFGFVWRGEGELAGHAH